MKRSPLKRRIPLRQRSRINPMSKKRKAESKEYSKLRKQYLSEHPHCEIRWDSGCTSASTQVHHKARRHGKNYLDTSKFCAACAHCHWMVEHNGREAEQRGFIIREYKAP